MNQIQIRTMGQKPGEGGAAVYLRMGSRLRVVEFVKERGREFGDGNNLGVMGPKSIVLDLD